MATDRDDDTSEDGFETINDLIPERMRLENEKAAMRLRMKDNSERITKLSNRIDVIRLGGTLFDATDHAIVRYLQRVKGFDMAALRAEINAAAIAACQGFDPSNKIVAVEHGLTFIFGERCKIASVWPTDSEPPPGTKIDDKAVIKVKPSPST